MKSRVFLILTLISLPFLPLSCVSIVFLLNLANPMLLAFITPVTVENRLQEEIRITPIGVYGKEGRRAVLPQYAAWDSVPVVFPCHGRNLRIPPGGAITIHYDWDDINFSEILVRTAQWEKVLIVDLNPTSNRYHPPEQTVFVVDDVEKLQPASDNVLSAAGAFWSPTSRMIGLPALGAVVLVIFAYSLSRFLKTRKAERVPPVDSRFEETPPSNPLTTSSS